MLFDNNGNKLDSVMKPLYITSVVTGVNDPAINGNSIKIYPNPTSDNSNVSFHISNRSQTMISVTNLNGQKLLSYNKGTLLPGNYNQTIPVNKLAAGTYFISIETGNTKVYKKIVVVH